MTKKIQKKRFSDPQKATILYQLNRHELIEAAAGSQDAIEVFLSHKVEAQNLLKLSLDDDIDDAVRFLGGKINPVGNQDYDKAFSSEYWNRMKIRNTLLMIEKVQNLQFSLFSKFRDFFKKITKKF